VGVAERLGWKKATAASIHRLDAIRKNSNTASPAAPESSSSKNAQSFAGNAGE